MESNNFAEMFNSCLPWCHGHNKGDNDSIKGVRTVVTCVGDNFAKYLM